MVIIYLYSSISSSAIISEPFSVDGLLNTQFPVVIISNNYSNSV